MRCKSCNYPLWNLHARQCPECGAPFAPSAFEFVPSSVAFCCPQCDHAYYGTDDKGRLQPVEFDCVACGRHVHIDEMVLRPAEGLQEWHTRTGDMPWLDRKERGRVTAWFATVWAAMIHPARLMRGVPEQSPVAAAWWYAILTTLVLTVARMVPAICFLPIIFLNSGSVGGVGGGGGPGAGSLIGIAAGSTVVITLIMLVVLFASLVLWGLVCHAVLRAGGRPAGGLGRTFQALCYSSGANAITVVPCIGDLSFVWWITSAVIMVREGQRVSGRRATIAVLAYPVLGIVLAVGFYAAIVGMIIGGARAGVATQSVTIQTAELATLGPRVTAFAAARGGAPPAHALELVPENRSGTGIFISASTATDPDDVPVNDGTLSDFRQLGPNRQLEAAQRAAAALPPGVVAHRVGDFVFTWHGMDLSTPDPGLWLAVASPDPDANPDTDPDAPTVAVLADGTTRTIGAGEMPRMLRRQNELRATRGLPPLPAPEQVTHAQPAAR